MVSSDGDAVARQLACGPVDEHLIDLHLADKSVL